MLNFLQKSDVVSKLTVKMTPLPLKKYMIFKITETVAKKFNFKNIFIKLLY